VYRILLLTDKVTELIKMKTDLFNSIISVFSITLIILGAVPNLAFALDGQLGDGADSTNSTPHSDLRIEKFYTDPEAPRPNSNVVISVVVKNVGDAPSNPMYLILAIDGASSMEYSEPIGPGSEVAFSQNWTTPAQEGTVILKASIDGVENNPEEIDLLVENPRPDLIIQKVVPEPTDPQEGGPLNFTFNVKNQGAAPSGESLATYYINGIPGQNINIPSLPEGASADASFSLTPDQVKGGQMEVEVVADSGNTVLESNESNNRFPTTIKVKGLPLDLTIESIYLNPETPKVGDNITFTATIKNSGPGASPASKLKYNINGTNGANSSTLSSDMLTVRALAAGETTQITFFFAPTNEGNIEITAVIDPGTVIPEIDETNNQRIITVTITKDSTSTDGGGGGGSSSGSEGSGSGGSSSGSGGSSSSKSSSGGGIGSSYSKEPAKNVASKELATRNVMSGIHVKFDFLQNNTCIQYIEYDALRTFMKTTTTVEELKNKSTFVPKLPPGKIYKHVNIWVGEKGGGLSTSLKNGIVGFRVEKTWIKTNNVNESLVALQLYNKSWMLLNTEKVGEDDNYVYFKSETPSYSMFAITENTGETDKNGIQIDSKLPNIGKRAIGKNETNFNAQEVRNTAKKLMAFALPAFLICVGYLVIKKKI
jgi:PGF-pre-PGF domain-containing protein